MNFRVVGLRQLASGGYGDVFIGQRNDTGEYVVRKILREWHLQHAREGFEREVRVLARGLPGLVPLLAWDLTAQPPFYIMPYLAGGALTKYAGTLSTNQLHNVAGELAQTLANLHSALEVHGDVKPDNILVTQDGRLQIADPLGNGTLFTMLFSGNRGGTPGYWAPEVRNGGSISRAGDVYSYGVRLHHLLTGRKPQEGQNLYLTQQEQVRAPKLSEIIKACCQIEPDSRPSMYEVLRMLGGSDWADIQGERERRRLLATAACLVTGVIFLGVALRGKAGG